jgi:carboxypeptidase family protein
MVMALSLQVTLPDLRAQVASGMIGSTARNSSGAVVPKANISCKNVETGVVRNVTTDDKGAYIFPALPIGSRVLLRGLREPPDRVHVLER